MAHFYTKKRTHAHEKERDTTRGSILAGRSEIQPLLAEKQGRSERASARPTHHSEEWLTPGCGGKPS